jgi:RNA-directed DNA polymerase
VVTGHQAYDAVPGNSSAVTAFRTQVTRHFRHALQSRSHKGRVAWDPMNRLAARWLPPSHTRHRFPEQRFAASHPWQEPVR